MISALAAGRGSARALARRVAAGRFRSQAVRFASAEAASTGGDDDVEEKEQGEGLIATLSNPVYALPLGGLVAMTGVATDFYILGEETQLLGLWVLFCGTIYHNFGDMIGEAFDDMADAVAKEQNAQEHAIVESMEITKAAHERQTAIYEDIKAIFEAQKELMDTIVAGKSMQLHHDFRSQIVSKLNNIVSEEAGLTSDVQSGLVNAATKQVRASITTDAAKKVALEQAIAAIASPDTPPGKDQVSDMYNAVFADFAKNLAAAKEEEQTLSAEVKAAVAEDIAAVARRDGLDFISVATPEKVAIGEV